jgi:hypothetical protein
LKESTGVDLGGRRIIKKLCEPERHLKALCDALDVAFDPAMLSWPAGPRPTDGVWAKYWYKAVQGSTGFTPYRPKDEPVPAGLRQVLDRCRSDYERLYAYRLRSD